MFKYFLWIYFVGFISSSMTDNYCELCNNHTMCEFKNRSPVCGKQARSGISVNEAEEIVFMHNFYRSKVANGSVICGSPGPQPPAANMNALMWDKDLAEVAQRWADQCNFDHDECRRDHRFQVGQNMFVSIGPSTVDWRKVIKSWYSGVIKFNKSTIDNFQVNINTNFYTQLVSANTKYIGCGRTIFETISDDREKSLKYNEFISSTVNGLKLKKSIKNRPDSLSINTKNHRTKRSDTGYYFDDAGYFGDAGYYLKAAEGALGTVESSYETLEKQSMIEFLNNPNNHQTNRYNMELQSANYGTIDDSSLKDLSPYDQPSQSYQQFSTINNNYNNRYNYPSEQPNFYLPQKFQPSNYPGYLTNHYSNYYFPSSKTSDLGLTVRQYEISPFAAIQSKGDNVFMTSENGLENGYDYFSEMNIPDIGTMNYQVQTSSRVARSVNSESSIRKNDDSDDDDSYYDDDDDISIASESKHQAENEPLNRKTFTQEANAQHSTKTRKQIFVCNYGPTGNIIDQPIYIRGKPCSKCPPNTTCKNGLCL